MSVWFSILTVLFILSSVTLVLVILVQRPQGGGLAQAFGGASGGGTDTAFGGRTGDVLTYLTMGAFGFYLLVAIGLNVLDTQNAAFLDDPSELEMIEPGLVPTDPALAATATGLVPTATPATDVPAVPATQASDSPLIAPAPAQPAPDAVPAANQPLVAPAVPAPAPAPAEAPAGKP